MIKPQTLKGFRDFLPPEARKRQYVINEIRKTFELYGFEQLETPVLEYEDILSGKYGEEGEKLMYRFEDHGKRKVAMRYDQTIPLARLFAQYQHLLPIPFKRYQVQNVWRAENTQRGRFREFLQCDADIVGTSSPLADANIIMTALAGLHNLGFKQFTVLVNDRKVFDGIPTEGIIAIDKLKKIGPEKVKAELVQKNVCKDMEEADALLEKIKQSPPSNRLAEILKTIDILKQALPEDVAVVYEPTLARGLDYYTSTIFEIEIANYPVGSVCGGGRYDNLIGMFGNQQVPAVGFAYGIDRILDAMEELHLFSDDILESTTKVLVTVFSDEYLNDSLRIARVLVEKNINEELYPWDKGTKLEKQLKYAYKKNIPYVVIFGPDEKKAHANMVTIRNMKTKEQQQTDLESFINWLTSKYK